MTDQTTPDVTDDDRRRAREWAEFIESDMGAWRDGVLAAARVVLHAVPAPSRPTLADMTDEERDACQWMQADVKGDDSRAVIVNPYWVGAIARVMWPDTRMGSVTWERITPRPDLPRMEWPGDQKAEDVAPVRVGDVIESADDPRVSALPAGTVLRDLDGEEVVKRGGDWVGLGYVPRESEGTEFGPWTVARLPKKADPAPAPALPDGWRLADHEVYGRVVVTSATPSLDGRVYFVFHDVDDDMGYDWDFCPASDLTHLGLEADQ